MNELMYWIKKDISNDWNEIYCLLRIIALIRNWIYLLNLFIESSYLLETEFTCYLN